MKPLIGITSYTRCISDRDNADYDVAYRPNVVAIEQAGGLPIVIPSGLDHDSLRGIYERVDGILLPGGGDVHPDYYSAERHPATTRIHEARDNTEITIIRWAVEDDRPILGICRGIQVMNVALGGTLIQDIPTLVEAPLKHNLDDGLPRSTRLHEIEICSGSRLAHVLGVPCAHVNSLHHQAIERIAPSATMTAYSADRIIEAIELPDKLFFLGVQWHPEDLQDDSRMRNLFKAFVEAARVRMRVR